MSYRGHRKYPKIIAQNLATRAQKNVFGRPDIRQNDILVPKIYSLSKILLITVGSLDANYRSCTGKIISNIFYPGLSFILRTRKLLKKLTDVDGKFQLFYSLQFHCLI